MPNKVIKTRIQHKHDYEANWIKAVDFVPLKGEFIIYDAETEELFASQYANLTDEQKATIRRCEAITYVRTKIGNGVDIVTDLPFYSSNANENNNPDWNQNDEYQPGYIKNRTHYTEDNGTIHKLDAKYIPVDGETISVKTSGLNIEPGAYTPDGTFSNREYTWDEMVARNDLSEYPYVDFDKEFVYIFNINHDIVVPYSALVVTEDSYESYYEVDLVEMGGNNVILPENTTNIGTWARDPIGTIYIKATNPPILEYPFNVEIERIAVPIGCGDAYKSATNWSELSDIIVEDEMFGETKNVLSANIPDIANKISDNTTITVNTSNKLSVKDSYKDDVDTYLSRLSETEQPEFMSKTLIAAKNYTDKQLSEFDFIKIVDSLPAEGLENRIYLVPVSTKKGEFPNGEPGAYTADGTFSNLEYTWDELITRESKPYVYIKADDYADIVTDNHDIIVSNNLEGADACPFDCNGKNIVLPESVTFVDTYQESAIGILYIKATTPPEVKSTFNIGIDSIVVPQGCGDSYKSATNWSNYADIIEEIEDNIIDTGDQNLFNEWVWVNKNEGTNKEAEYVWEYVSTKTLDIDLTAYVKRTEMTAYVEEKLLTGTW